MDGFGICQIDGAAVDWLRRCNAADDVDADADSADIDADVADGMEEVDVVAVATAAVAAIAFANFLLRAIAALISLLRVVDADPVGSTHITWSIFWPIE